MPTYKLSPSDFGFLWDDCKRCFWLKVVKGFPPPPSPFPKIFNVIDKAMKNAFQGKRSELLAPGVPSGTVFKADDWVESAPITIKGKEASCFIRGIFDTVLQLDDGGYAVTDYKTSTIGPDQALKYGRQLHAYAKALELPAKGQLHLEPVTTLGLLVYQPESFASRGDGKASLSGTFQWLEVIRNAAQFDEFLGEVLDVLARPDPPKPGPNCKLCAYRAASRKTGF